MIEAKESNPERSTRISMVKGGETGKNWTKRKRIYG
jgi:hypothetical protein